MKYLVTGGAGFIGSNIVNELLKRGEQVRVLDNFATGKRENLFEFKSNPNFELIEGDLRSFHIVRNAVKGCIHKASPGGGHILSSSNSIHAGVPPENFIAMVEAAREYGEYPIRV